MVTIITSRITTQSQYFRYLLIFVNILCWNHKNATKCWSVLVSECQLRGSETV